jgi:SNF2 family DNA or RNA helicase
MDLKIGYVTGASILDARVSEKSKNRDIAGLNEGRLDGLIVTDKCGATGLNLVGANHIIFLGSLYSWDYEKQAIGNTFSLVLKF